MNNSKNNKILLIDITNEKIQILKNEFITPIENIIKTQNSNYEIIPHSKLKETKTKQYSHIIISGTALKDFEYLNHLENFSTILNSKNHKILGICAGSQIIAKHFGAELSQFQEIGMTKIKILKQTPILENFTQQEVYLMHNLSFTKPKNFETIIETKIPVLIKHKDLEIYACLFHPEVKTEKIIENFCEL